MACGKISQNVISSICNKIAASGTTTKVYLANFEDVDKVNSTPDSENEGVLKKFALVDGAKLYKLTSKNNASTGTAELSRDDLGNQTFQHTVELRAYAKNQETKDFMNGLLGADVVIIIENREDGAYKADEAGALTENENQATKYEVYGWDAGLSVSALPWSTELSNGVTYAATFSTPPNGFEGALPKTILYEKGQAASRIAATAAGLEEWVSA